MDVSRRGLLSGIGVGAALAYAGNPLLAAGGEQPILTITGRISRPSLPDGSAQFARPALEALGHASITTRTPWYDGAVTFEGVPMATLMQAVGAEGETLLVHALNDYVTEVPFSDFARFGVLLALKRDGRYMPVRDKGPLFMVYPYDKDPALQNQTYYSRSAWQISQMRVA